MALRRLVGLRFEPGPLELRGEGALLRGVNQDGRGLQPQRLVVRGDYLRRAAVGLDGDEAQQAIGEAVDGPDRRGIEAGEGGEEPAAPE